MPSILKPIIYIILCFSYFSIEAQTINGPTSVNAGVWITYTLNSSQSHFSTQWVVTNGTKRSATSTGVEVKWNSGSSGRLEFHSTGSLVTAINVTISGSGGGGGGGSGDGGSGDGGSGGDGGSVPGMPTVNPVDACGPQQVTLVATDGGDDVTSYRWYETETQSVPTHTGSTYSPSIFNLGISTYYASAYNSAGEGSRSSVRVRVLDTPQFFSLSGPDTFCSSSGNISLTLNGSEQSVRYQLMRNEQAHGEVKFGNGSPIVWTDLDLEGEYTILADNEVCPARYMGQQSVENLLPADRMVSADLIICPETTNRVYLHDSEDGISYQLYRNGSLSNAGNPREGTGLTISWVIDTEGDYTVKAENSSCSRVMSTIVSPYVPDAVNINAGDDLKLFHFQPSINLSGSPEGGQWSGAVTSDGVFNPVNKSGVERPVSYDLSYTYDTDLVCRATDEMVITVYPNPLIKRSGTLAGLGSSALLYLNTTFDSYEWFWNGQYLSDKKEVDVLMAGSYHVRVGLISQGEWVYATSAPILLNSTIIDYEPNAVIEHRALKSGFSTVNSVVSNQNLDLINTTEYYYDGKNRLIQTVSRGGSASKQDVAQSAIFDAFDRSNFQLLPYSKPVNSGFDKQLVSNTLGFYQTEPEVAHDINPFSHTIYDAYPKNEVVVQGSVGVTWQTYGDKAIIINRLTNDNSNDHVKDFHLGNDLPNSTPGYYDEQFLYKTFSTDEEGHHVIEFSDNRGRTILKRVQVTDNASPANYVSTDWAETYYIYDDFGNLRYVLPPEAVFRFSEYQTPSAQEDFLNRWAFQYKYDYRNRMVEKRVPGSEWVYLVYDNRDRLVLTQDGNQRENNKWIFTKNDALNRPIATGENASGASRDQVKNLVNNGSFDFYETRDNTIYYGYTNQSFPTSGITAYLSFTYYDDYSFKSLTGFDEGPDTDYDYDPTELSGLPASSYSAKGLVTGTKTKQLGSLIWLNTANYYDDRYRLIQTISSNHKGGKGRSSTLYNFPGWVMKNKTSYTIPGQESLAIERRFEYDHAGRLLRGFHQVFKNGLPQGEVLLAENGYNELGELVEKNLHVENGTPLQSVDYRYNIRGWLESINTSDLNLLPGVNINDPVKDLFGMELIYNNPLNGVN